MNRLILIGLATVALSACEKREVPRPSADAPPADSAAAAVDTAARADTATARPTPAPIIGRDSAFGPIGAIDDSGKLVPLPVRRP